MLISLVWTMAALAAGPSVPWTRNYTKAFADAEEQRRPIVLFFTGECGAASRPVNPVTGGPVDHEDDLSPCDRMQQDVWENAAVVTAAARYVPVLADGGDRTLQTRYQAVRMPTTLVADPWGNEVFRSSGYLPPDKVTRILEALPKDFSALAAAGRTLKAVPTDFGALFSAGQFYEGAGLPQVSERLYAAALDSPGAADVAARRQVVIARGLNLMAHLNHADQAASLFEKELGVAPDGPGSDALLLGLVNAQVAQGHRREAEAAVKRMDEGFPGSPYTARAKQVLALARK